jgi:hypothetical protein
MRLAIAILVLSAATARADDRHLVYAEALGKGGLYGVGYEYRLMPWLAIGGAGSFSALRGQHVTTLAPYVHVTLLGRRAHALFSELGAVLAHSAIASPVPDWDGMTTTGTGGFATLGYEHASHRMILRASAGVAAGFGGPAPMVGFAIGLRP